MKRIAVASHIALIDGKQYDSIGNSLIKTLSSICSDFVFVRHSIDGLLRSEIHEYGSSKVTKVVKLRVFSRISPLRYFSEVFSTVSYFLYREKVDIYVGIDPLNGLAGVLLKKLKRVDKAIFFTSDYSDNRFTSRLMSKIYHMIDSYCVKNADEVWSVSSRIVEIRKNMGLADGKNIFVPNVPPVEFNGLRKNIHNKYSLITYGIIDKQLDFEGSIRAVGCLSKKYPKISLTIVGNGPAEERLKKLSKDLNISNRVYFAGRQPFERTLELASQSGIGLALYTGVWGFNKYGDSTKCREYFNFGLPVISTDTHSTVGEIKESGAGIITDLSVDEYVKAIEKIIDNYDSYSKKSLELGKKYEGIHKKEFLRILNN
jgi:glycosyltransferase involved in cell wall biosynthesis